MPTIRTTRKLLLGREIAHLLHRTGTTQAEAARMIETSAGRMTSIVNGGSSISLGDLTLLAEKLGIDDDGYFDALNDLRRDSHKRGYWTTGHNRAYAEDIRLLVDLEQHADQIQTVHAELVPGILQSEPYIRAQYRYRANPATASVGEHIEARLARGQLLVGDDPPTAQFILSESCLRRVCGDAGTMRAQAQHLLELSDRRNIHIQVLPFDLPGPRQLAISNMFTLLTVPSPGVAGPLECAYVEGEGEIRYLDDADALKAHRATWTALSDSALRFEESRDFLRQVREDFDM